MVCSVRQTDMFSRELIITALVFITQDDQTRTSANRMLQFDCRNVLVNLLTHLNVLFICSAAGFGPWSEYGDCSCDSLQSRSRVCEAEPCDGELVESIACECVPFNAAGMMFCTTSIVLIVITDQ